MAALTRAAIGADGWCGQALRYDSPNCDARPAGAQVELLVVHNISLPAGRFGGPHIADLFTNRVDFAADPSFADLRGLTVSAHFLVRRDGAVLQFVSCEQRAWHAGVSRFGGREQCNDFSVGVEMEGSDFVAFSPAQYESLAALTLALAARYPLAAVQGHEHVAPGRKTDPGPYFDWEMLANRLSEAAARLPHNSAVLVTAHRLVGVVSALKNVNPLHQKK
ncbi:MAG: 1,6-anhydro-N-acetylmuramyl-L-alanine amidase AmpD [Pseudomonadota bacterium]|nr:1,6-anhydro-N-acetylmuramyl-L-alanine amidase AmpD [Pseudomonadota bacterium]